MIAETGIDIDLEHARARHKIELLELKKLLMYSGPDPVEQARSVAALARLLGYDVRAPHLKIIAHQNETHYGGRRDDLVLGFRGLGKSTVGTVVRAIKYVIENPNVRILLTSDTAGAAQAFLREIRGHLQTNETLVEMFGPFFDPSARTEIGRYREGFATVFQRTDATLREPTFSCIGIGGQMASRHFEVIFADDLVTLDKSRTPTQRKVLTDWYGSTLLGACLPHTKVHYLGTRYYPHDLWQDLSDGRVDEVHGPLHGATLKLPMVSINAETGEWTSNDPGCYDIETCKAARRRMGAYHFNAQMQQDTTSGEGIIFNYGDFRWYGGGDNMPPREMVIYQYHDLAAKKTDTGDFYVGCTIGVAETGGERSIWVLDLVRERAGMKRQRELIISQAEQWKPLRSGVEAVAMQAGFAEEIKQTTLLPVQPVEVETDKVFRARRVSFLVEANKVYFPTPDTPLGERCLPLIEELTTFPESENDDCVDALVGALTLALYGGPPATMPTLEDTLVRHETGLRGRYDDGSGRNGGLFGRY